MLKIKWNAVFTVALLLAVAAQAQTFGEVRGRLLLPDGAPAAGVKVELGALNHAARPIFSEVTITDARGRFHFPFAPLGTNFLIRAFDERGPFAASGLVGFLSHESATILVGRLRPFNAVSEGSDCGGFSGFRDAVAGSFTMRFDPKRRHGSTPQAEEVILTMICM